MEIPGFLLDQRRALLMLQPFTQNITFTGLATATSADGSFTTQNDSDFIITKTTYYCHTVTTAAPTESTRVIPWATVLLKDSGSGRQLQDSATMLSALFGTGELPYIWGMPYKVNGNSTITATVANITTGAGETYNIRLQFHGVKVFYGGLK